jgi:hypothetical protein
MRVQDYAPRPAHLKWLLDSDPAIRWQVMRDLADEAPNAVAAERSRIATEGWGAQLLALQSPAGNWGDRGLLITLYTLVVLKDLGLGPASKEARKMIDRVDKRLVFKPLNNRSFLHGETEPCVKRQNPQRRLVFQRTERRTGQSALGRAARRWRLELRSTEKPALFVPYHDLRARRTARIRTSKGQIGGRH